MMVIYFTDGSLIDDVRIRRLLVRIPEVISTLRAAEHEFVNCDLFLSMQERQVFESLNYHQREYLKTLLQKALFNRCTTQSGLPDLILKRKDYQRIEDLKSVFRKLATIDHLKVVTIGPGFDELEGFLRRELGVIDNLRDFLAADPLLDWFWSDLKSELQFHS